MDPRSGPARARSRQRTVVRRHLPFLAFVVVFIAYCAYLQFEFAAALGRLALTRIFFQVALAALVVAALKNAGGVRTLGTFGPVIIALAFLATGLPLGLALFGLILGIVLLVRGAIVREHVQQAHRVAILVTIVGITISSIGLIGLEFGHHELFFAVLFPVLISAWIAEGYVEQVNRVGWDGPTLTLGWTVAAVVIAFLVITQDWLVDFVLLNPLTWPALIVLNWFLGTRVRFRLSERFRFGGVRRYALGKAVVAGDFGGDVLTMTVRNREFEDRYNPPKVMARLAKDEVKALLPPQGIPMARTYMVLQERKDLAAFRTWLAGQERFALKPAAGFGGEGIILVRGRHDGGTFDTNLGPMTAAAIEAHAATILEGEFRGGERDSAVVEELIVQDQALREVVPVGLADIRLICFLGYPAMAMLRVPTTASAGKANLHVGAVGAGVRISTGTIVHAVWRGEPQPTHPDTDAVLVGRSIPRWDEILEVSSEAQRLTGLGFAGVDIALDATRGPIVMEVNRRPGLEIQNANAAGLLRRLRAIEALPRAERPVEERIAVVKRLDAEDWGLRKSPPVPSSDHAKGSLGET